MYNGACVIRHSRYESKMSDYRENSRLNYSNQEKKTVLDYKTLRDYTGFRLCRFHWNREQKLLTY